MYYHVPTINELETLKALEANEVLYLGEDYRYSLFLVQDVLWLLNNNLIRKTGYYIADRTGYTLVNSNPLVLFDNSIYSGLA